MIPSSAWTVMAEAETAPQKLATSDAWTWLVILTAIVIVAFIVAGIAIYIVRNRTLREETTQADVPLTLHEVRQMHARGEIDDGEMERLKGIVMEQAKKDRPRPPAHSEEQK